jgi:hypothetical protein
MGEQQPHRLRVVLADRPHERGVAQPRLGSVDIGATLDEQSDEIQAARANRRHEQRVTRAVGRIDARAGIEEPPRHSHVAVLGSNIGGRDAEGVGGRHARAGFDQRLGNGQAVGPDGPVKCGRAVGVGGVDVPDVAQQPAHGGEVAVCRGLQQPLVGASE